MTRLLAAIAATLLAGFVAGAAQAQNSYRVSTQAEVKERFRTDPQFAARHHTYDRETVGVTPAGATEPNRPPTGGLPPRGDKVYYRHGAEATNCSSNVRTVKWPDGQERPTRMFTCVRP